MKKPIPIVTKTETTKLLSNLKAYDFAKHLHGGLKRDIDVRESANALRKIADSLEADQVWLREVTVLTKVQANDYVSTTVTLTIYERQRKDEEGTK